MTRQTGEVPASKGGLHDFSPGLGGPLFRLYVRAHLSQSDLELLHRRILVLTLLAWVPLLALTLLSGRALGDSIAVPFLKDFEAHARFLVALPLLVAGEVIAHDRIRSVLRQFFERDLVPPESRERFEAALDAAARQRDSVVAELLLLALAYAVHPLWLSQLALAAPTWFATPGEGGLVLTWAGAWYAFVSIPFFRFLWFRWLFRLAVWGCIMWRVSRIELKLLATHPDGAAGLGFLGGSALALAPVLAAQGALLSGYLANRIFHTGAKLTDFKLDILGCALCLALFVLGPLCVFSMQILRARRAGLRRYGVLASRYVRDFDRKWVEGGAAGAAVSPEELLGSGDIQSLADLGNAYQLIKATRPFPFGREAVVGVVVATLLPIAPLVLTLVPLEELVNRLLGIVI